MPGLGASRRCWPISCRRPYPRERTLDGCFRTRPTARPPRPRTSSAPGSRSPCGCCRTAGACASGRSGTARPSPSRRSRPIQSRADGTANQQRPVSIGVIVASCVVMRADLPDRANVRRPPERRLRRRSSSPSTRRRGPVLGQPLGRGSSPRLVAGPFGEGARRRADDVHVESAGATRSAGSSGGSAEARAPCAGCSSGRPQSSEGVEVAATGLLRRSPTGARCHTRARTGRPGAGCRRRDARVGRRARRLCLSRARRLDGRRHRHRCHRPGAAVAAGAPRAVGELAVSGRRGHRLRQLALHPLGRWPPPGCRRGLSPGEHCQRTVELMMGELADQRRPPSGALGAYGPARL